MGFEPTRAEHIGLAVQRLNHSAGSSHASRREYFMTSSLSAGLNSSCYVFQKRRQILSGHLPIEFKNLLVKWK